MTTFSGYAYMSETQPRITRCNQAEPESVFHLDWESVRDTADEAIEYARQWHDAGPFTDGRIVRITATVEEVASLVDIEEPFTLK